MSSLLEPRTKPRWARILLAAVRLAAIYAAGVLILLVPLMIWSRRREFAPDGQPLFALSVIGAVCFALGFVALAAVKRLGFVVLWGLLVWFWIIMLRDNVGFLAFLDLPFLLWSAFAVPLYILSAVGLTETVGSRRGQIEAVLMLVIWAIIAGVAFFFPHPVGQYRRIEDPGLVFYYTKTLQGYVYAAWPLVICARELGRVAGALWRSRKDAA